MHKYEIVIWWSDEDQLFLAKAPELGSGCMAHGHTTEEALHAMNTLIPHWLETLRETGRPVPEPRGEFVPVN